MTKSNITILWYNRYIQCIVSTVVVVVVSHIQRIVLATEESTATQQVSHRPIKCQSRLLVVTKRYEGQRVTSR